MTDEPKPKRNPRFKKPRYIMQFRVEPHTRRILETLGVEAEPLDNGEQPSTAEVARSLLDQQAKKLTGNCLWLRRDAPIPEANTLFAKAGYSIVRSTLDPNPYEVDWEAIEEKYHSVCVNHPFHAIEAYRRGLTVVIFDKVELRAMYGTGLVRRWKLL